MTQRESTSGDACALVASLGGLDEARAVHCALDRRVEAAQHAFDAAEAALDKAKREATALAQAITWVEDRS